MRKFGIVAGLMASIMLAPVDVVAHSKSHVFFGVTLGPFWYGPPAYYYAPPAYYYPPPVAYYPPPPVYYPPASVYGADCRPIQGRGEETGRIYDGIACRQPDGTWRVTPR